MNKLFLYYHTLKYVKPIQIVRRIFRKIHKPTQRKVSLLRRLQKGQWQVQTLKEQVLFAGGECEFLNQRGAVLNSADWNDSAKAKLWLYNLHYFDDFVSASEDKEVQREWLNRWLQHNNTSHGNGWEPYPISLRSVNWIKAILGGMEVTEEALESLASQIDYLTQDLEFHLLGNHLFVNAKALVFAGCFFSGKTAEQWLSIGTKILLKEIDEQTLNDGSNFELTPMYHAIILVDLLDLLNLSNTYPDTFPGKLKNKIDIYIPRMINVLRCMTHPDGRPGFFNDSTCGIAPSISEIESYAVKLGLQVSPRKTGELIDFEDSGYVCYCDDNISLIADLANIGPDYIPGHAHADTLSFELSVFGHSVFVNSGISEYGLSPERLRQRQTSAHNTVSINAKDSSVVWSGFRVAQRARIIERSVNSDEKTFSASHNGFKNQGVNALHLRSWQLRQSEILITDIIEGHFDKAFAYLHLHPNTVITDVNIDRVKLKVDGGEVIVRADGAIISISDTTWHPGFGLSVANKRIDFEFEQSVVKVFISWSRH